MATMILLRLIAKMGAQCSRDVLNKYAETPSGLSQPHDALLTSVDVGQHAYGEFSMAHVQANVQMEDRSEVEVGSYGTFVGIYDGHGGVEASQYIKDHLFLNTQKTAQEQGEMSCNVLRKAFIATEEGFLNLVANSWKETPKIVSAGSCSLVGVIWRDMLYVANLGDSRAVLGCNEKLGGKTKALQLSTEHNASMEAVRKELQTLHPNDSHIVVLKHGVWRIKGIIQVSRSIGDIYLKKPEFNREPLLAKFRLDEPLQGPVLTAEPSIIIHKLKPQDEFIIFASDGLWEHLSNEKAVEIVRIHPREGSATRLIKAALQEVARKREIRYSDLVEVDGGIRRYFHDDISVVVVFVNHKLMSKKSSVL